MRDRRQRGRFTGFATGCPGTGTPLAVSQLAVEGAVDMVLGPATREGQRSTLTLSFARMVTEAGDAEADARAVQAGFSPRRSTRSAAGSDSQVVVERVKSTNSRAARVACDHHTRTFVPLRFWISSGCEKLSRFIIVGFPSRHSPGCAPTRSRWPSYRSYQRCSSIFSPVSRSRLPVHKDPISRLEHRHGRGSPPDAFTSRTVSGVLQERAERLAVLRLRLHENHLSLFDLHPSHGRHAHRPV